jgi:adenylate cyclase
MATTRRLTAILAADVAGYSRLMGEDEEGTHARLKGHFEQLIEPKVREHQGRIVKTTGDGALVEFASVVDAMRCAAEIQRGMIDRDAELPDERRVRFRIGVNLGDVIAEDGDIFGEGVNVAARLEALAEPGGICLSRTVREQIRDKLPYKLDDLGEQSVKNIARPVRVFALRPETVAVLSKTEVLTAPRPAQQPGYPLRYIAAVAVAGVLIIAGALLSIWPSPKAPSANVTAPPLEKPAAPAAAPRLSIVVLPFANLSDDKEQQYFSDGISEDLTTDLSRIQDSFVISRNTAFTYKDKSVDTKQIGRELGVRYVLEGSVQRSGNQVRVNAQLIDAETDAHIWAERFERDIGDLFALQDEVTGRIANALNVALVGAEAARPTANPDALDYILRGRASLSKPETRSNFAETTALFEHALALDPHSGAAQSWLAIALAVRVITKMTDSPGDDIARAQGLAEQAVTAFPLSPLAHYAKGQVLRAQNRYEEAIPEYATVLASNRNWAHALAVIGWCKFMSGSIEEMIPAQEQAIRLSPRDPLIDAWYFWIGEAHLLQSRTDEAILWFEKARIANPAIPGFHLFLASAYALKGESGRAAAELAEARRLSRDDRYSSIARVKAFWDRSGMASSVRSLLDATFIAGLRRAGIPEE